MLRRLTIPLLAVAMLAVSLAFASPNASADPRDFTLINGSDSFVITHLYVQPSGPDDDWGDDILGQDVLGPGESAFIFFTRFTADNCFYDIKVIADTGAEGELLNVDLCSTDTVTFS